MEKEQTTIHRRQRRKPRFLWTVDLNLRSLRYLLFKIFRRRFCYRENTVSHRFAPARRSMPRLGVSWAEKEKTQSRNAESAINHLSRRSPAAVGRRRISGYALTRRGSGPPSFCLSWRVRPLSAAKKFPPRISWRTQQDRGCNSDRACA